MIPCRAVALGNNRNNGSNLGLWTLNANNNLVNSNGNNWRLRLELLGSRKLGGRNTNGMGLNLRHLKRAADTRVTAAR